MYYAAQDIIEYLMNSVGGGSQDSEHRMLRSAAHNAYRDVINARDWNWHIAEATLSDDATAGSGDGVESFTLPATVKNVDALIPPQNVSIPTVYVTPTDWLRVDIKIPTLNSPVYWTVVKDPSAPDRWLLKLAGTPTPTTYKYTYRRRPKPLQYMGYEPECRQAGFSVTGAVKRYGTATQYPDGLSGLHAFTAQEIIGLAGSLTATPPANAKTVVSDYVDASDSMFTAILSGTEVWLAKLMGKNVEGALTIYNRDLRMAFEADGAAPLSGTRNGGMFIGTARALGYYSPSGPDTGV